MSPITMAILGLLAYKALKSLTAQAGTATASPGTPAPAPNAGAGASPGGGLGDILKSGLGGLLGGGAAGGVLTGGLNDLLKQLQDAGHGEVAKSWVGTGPNRSISSDDLANALGADRINALTSQTGLSREELLDGLSQHLPQAIDTMTPNGRMPTEDEMRRSI
jgi:uncharacterized protein YidB (DUF937 family)